MLATLLFGTTLLAMTACGTAIFTCLRLRHSTTPRCLFACRVSAADSITYIPNNRAAANSLVFAAILLYCRRMPLTVAAYAYNSSCVNNCYVATHNFFSSPRYTRAGVTRQPDLHCLFASRNAFSLRIPTCLIRLVLFAASRLFCAPRASPANAPRRMLCHIPTRLSLPSNLPSYNLLCPPAHDA